MDVNAGIRIWWETSEDGQTWERPAKAPQTAHEVARTPEELHMLLRAYTGVLENAAARLRAPWVRMVAQGEDTGRVLAVVPRRWNADTRQYESTGGEWQVVDRPSDLAAWVVDLTRARVSGMTRRHMPSATGRVDRDDDEDRPMAA
ncbi:hypothetical protein [Streptomyces sp. NPDC002644]